MLTGATGFVGQALVKEILTNQQLTLTVALRNTVSEDRFDKKVTVIPYLDMAAKTNWQSALQGCHTVIHTAARVHVMKENACNALSKFRQINVVGTLNLAQQAAMAGVKRFIFISSIKVNGESTAVNKPFKYDDIPQPQDAYAQSKYEAEQGLIALSRQTNIEIVIIRPPLVYGPGMKGNLQRLVDCLDNRLPLPLGAIKNVRSFVSIDNLVSLIMCCINNPKAANQIFLVSDSQDLSTTALLRKIGLALNKPPILLPVPVWLLRFLANLIGKQTVIERLCGSLQVDISKTCRLLDWQPNKRIVMRFTKLDTPNKTSKL